MIKRLLSICSFISLAACSNRPSDLNMIISLSSDGNYSITTNTNKQAVLWNLKDHSYKILWKDANIYSAYFIKNTNDFIFQDNKTNDVYIEDTNGNVIKRFNPGIATFGELVTSDLKTYIASDRWFQLYKTDLTTSQTKKFFYYYCGPNYENGVIPPAGMPYGCNEFVGADQLFNLHLTPDNKTLVATEGGALFIWDVSSAKLLKTIIKNDEQTVAAINPDGSYMVTADIMQRAVNYNFNTNLEKGFVYKFSSRPEAAAYYNNGGYPHEVLAAKFIDNNALLLILNGLNNPFNYAALFNPIQLKPTTNPYQTAPYLYDLNPIKYLPLIPNAATDTNYQKDWPLTSDDFSRDEAIDTSPSAHILVMSMAEKNGIIVYRYDPVTQILTREWAGEVKPWWKF